MSSFVHTFFAGVCEVVAGGDGWPGFCAGAAESFCANAEAAVNPTPMIAKLTAAKKLRARRFILPHLLDVTPINTRRAKS